MARIACGAIAALSPFLSAMALSAQVADPPAIHVNVAQPDAAHRTVSSQPSVPHGELAVMSGGRVLLVDPTSGASRAIACEWVYELNRPLVWSGDGTAVLYWCHAAGWHIWSANRDGTQQRRLTSQTDSRSVSVSPDGTQLAYMADGLWIAAADGSGARRLTTKGHRDQPATWSPDGKRLAFEHLGQDGSRRGVYVIQSSGDGERFLVAAGSPRWSPDGKLILVADGDLWLVDSDSNNRSRLAKTPGGEYWGHWSHDGRHVLFARSTHDPEPAGHALYVRDIESGVERSLAALTDPGELAVHASWSPDDRWIAFADGARDHRAVWIVNIDGTAPQKLLDNAECPAWRPAVED